jgi:hypothetical protein
MSDEEENQESYWVCSWCSKPDNPTKNSGTETFCSKCGAVRKTA